MAKTIAGSLGSFGVADYGLDEHIVTVDVATHAETGALLGGLLGCAAGLGASLMGFSISGAGPIGAASPMVMALTGAAFGAMAGGLIGALMEGVDQRVSRWRDSGWTLGRVRAALLGRRSGARAPAIWSSRRPGDPPARHRRSRTRQRARNDNSTIARSYARVQR